MAYLFKVTLIIAFFSITKTIIIPASGGYRQDKIIIIPSAHNMNDKGPHVVLSEDNEDRPNPYDATGRSGPSYDSHEPIQEDIDPKYRRSFISGAGSIFSGPIVIVADRLPAESDSEGPRSGGEHSSYSDSRDQGWEPSNDYQPTYKGAPKTVTVTESVTVDKFTTVTKPTQNRVTVVRTDFSYVTETITTREAVRTPVNNAVSIVHSEFSQPRTIEVTNVNTGTSYVTQIATETRTLVHTVSTTDFRTVTTDVQETVLVTVHQVRTSIEPNSITETETVYVTSTEYVEEEMYEKPE